MVRPKATSKKAWRLASKTSDAPSTRRRSLPVDRRDEPPAVAVHQLRIFLHADQRAADGHGPLDAFGGGRDDAPFR